MSLARELLDVELSDEGVKKLDQLNKDFLRAELIAERASNKILEPVFKRRREAVKDIPKFWPVALMNSTLATFIQADDDIKALSALEDVWVQRDPTESRVFTIEFHFKENPYFSDRVLKKVYKYIAPPSAKDEKPDEDGITESMLEFDWDRDVETEATKISWKSDSVNLVKKMPRVIEDEEAIEPGSFFAFFTEKEDALQVGLTISNIFSDAVNYFLGKAEDMSEDEDEEDEEDDDDDAEEIDLEKPEKKRRRRE